MSAEILCFFVKVGTEGGAAAASDGRELLTNSPGADVGFNRIGSGERVRDECAKRLAVFPVEVDQAVDHSPGSFERKGKKE